MRGYIGVFVRAHCWRVQGKKVGVGEAGFVWCQVEGMWSSFCRSLDRGGWCARHCTGATAAERCWHGAPPSPLLALAPATNPNNNPAPVSPPPTLEQGVDARDAPVPAVLQVLQRQPPVLRLGLLPLQVVLAPHALAVRKLALPGLDVPVGGGRGMTGVADGVQVGAERWGEEDRW